MPSSNRPWGWNPTGSTKCLKEKWLDKYSWKAHALWSSPLIHTRQKIMKYAAMSLHTEWPINDDRDAGETTIAAYTISLTGENKRCFIRYKHRKNMWITLELSASCEHVAPNHRHELKLQMKLCTITAYNACRFYRRHACYIKFESWLVIELDRCVHLKSF